ncbi:hypothetical protein ACHAW6_004145 [Cyclotella cf. meneghiniana]
MSEEKNEDKRKYNYCSGANRASDDITLSSHADSYSVRNAAAACNLVKDPKAPYSEMEAGDAGFDEFLIFLESNSDFDVPSRSDAVRSGALDDIGKDSSMENNDDNAIHAEQHVEEKSEDGYERPTSDYARCDTTETQTSLQITAQDVAVFLSPLLNHDELTDSLKNPTTSSKSSDKLNLSYEDAVTLISTIEESIKRDSQTETEDTRRKYNSLNDRGRRAVVSETDRVTLDASEQAGNNGCFEIIWEWVMARTCLKKIKEGRKDGMAALVTII